MSASMSDMVAAPLTHTVNGNDYTISPLTLYEWGIFDRWLREQYAELARLSGNENIMDKLPLVSITNADQPDIGQTIQSLMSTPEGVAKIITLSVQKKHPDVTYDTAPELYFPETAMQLVQSILEISGLTTTGKAKTSKVKRAKKR